MRFEILGPLRAFRADDVPIDLGSPAERRLLAVLLAFTNEPVSDDRLIDELWGEAPPPSARHLLRVYVSRLRAVLGDGATQALPIVREGDGYRLRADGEELDAALFSGLLREARGLREGNPEAAHDAVSAALALWRGAPFADLPDPPASVRDHAEHLEGQHRDAIGLWAELGLQRGQHHELVPELTGLAARYPFDEELHAQLMLALYRCGRQADALELAHALEGRLDDELGIEPSGAIRDLYRDVLLQHPHLSLEPPQPPSNLPHPRTSFVGRTGELAEVAGLMEGTRLLTLTGPGGIGKTRLAVEAAANERTRFPGGVWWVDLAPVGDPRLVADEVARVVGLTRAPAAELVPALTRALHRRSALLVLDNCEHVIRAVASLVSVLLRDTVAPRILASSRVPLHVEGERLFGLPPLGLPPPDGVTSAEASDAVRLFVERARAVDPAFALTEGNVEAVAEVCRRMDGLPLAIEMAAARLPVLPPAELVQHLHHRLALLQLPTIDAPVRHRTLEAAIDVSYALLTDPQRRVFERLSVFAGPFDLEAAGAVGMPGRPVPEVVAALTALVEASMLSSEPRDGGARYRMLETLRAYATAALQRHRAGADARAAHAEHYLGLAAEAGEAGGTPAFAAWMPRLGDAYVELRQALEWSLGHDTRARALRAAPALWEFWFRGGDVREAARWSELMLAGDVDDVPPLLLAAAHQAGSFAADLENDLPHATAHADAAVALAREAGSTPMLICALWGRANVALMHGEVNAMRRDALEAIEAAKALPDRASAAGAVSALAFAAMVAGNADEAARLFDEAIPLYRELDDRGGLVIMALLPRAGIAVERGELEAAERYTSEAVAISGGTGWEAAALVSYADVLAEQDDLVAADRFASRGVRVALETGLELWFRRGARDLARNAARCGRFEQAAQLLGAASRGLPPHSIDPRVYLWTEARCRAELGDAAFERLASEGRSMTHGQVMDRLVGQGE